MPELPWGKAAVGVVVMVASFLVPFVAFKRIPDDLIPSTVWLWMAGAAALGLVTGFITGLSKKDGSGAAFMTFLGSGLLVPILGGVAAFLGQTEKVTEEFTYSNGDLMKKVTETATSFSDDSFLHPLAALGAFFLAFSALAILGLIGGALLRDAQLIEIMKD